MNRLQQTDTRKFRKIIIRITKIVGGVAAFFTTISPIIDTMVKHYLPIASPIVMSPQQCNSGSQPLIPSSVTYIFNLNNSEKLKDSIENLDAFLDSILTFHPNSRLDELDVKEAISGNYEMNDDNKFRLAESELTYQVNIPARPRIQQRKFDINYNSDGSYTDTVYSSSEDDKRLLFNFTSLNIDSKIN